jgi:SanA protein
MFRRVLAMGLGFGVVAVAAVAALNLYVASRSGDQTADVAAVPHAQTAIVLGAGLNRNGSMSLVLADRVHQAIALYRAGKVDRILVSGDHHTWGYDEPGTMRHALQQAGVPDEAIFTDHAGFDTWDSAQRARRVFDVRSAVVVTQGFHMARALFDARRAGLHVTGFIADRRDYGKVMDKLIAREAVARVKALAEAAVGANPRFLGAQIPITGDGRMSWGPPAPPGPAGH